MIRAIAPPSVKQQLWLLSEDNFKDTEAFMFKYSTANATNKLNNKKQQSEDLGIIAKMHTNKSSILISLKQHGLVLCVSLMHS